MIKQSPNYKLFISYTCVYMWFKMYSVTNDLSMIIFSDEKDVKEEIAMGKSAKMEGREVD